MAQASTSSIAAAEEEGFSVGGGALSSTAGELFFSVLVFVILCLFGQFLGHFLSFRQADRATKEAAATSRALFWFPHLPRRQALWSHTHPHSKRELVGVSILAQRHATLAPNASWWVSQFSDDDPHPRSKRKEVGLDSRTTPPHPRSKRESVVISLRHRHPLHLRSRGAFRAWLDSFARATWPSPKLQPCVTQHLATPPLLPTRAGGHFIATPTPPPTYAFTRRVSRSVRSFREGHLALRLSFDCV
jgi:hypothetical protein